MWPGYNNWQRIYPSRKLPPEPTTVYFRWALQVAVKNLKWPSQGSEGSNLGLQGSPLASWWRLNYLGHWSEHAFWLHYIFSRVTAFVSKSFFVFETAAKDVCYWYKLVPIKQILLWFCFLNCFLKHWVRYGTIFRHLNFPNHRPTVFY